MIWNNIQHLLSVGLKSVMPDVVFLGVEVVAAEARGVEESETHPILGQPAKYNFNGIVNHPHNNNGMNVEIYIRALADLPFLVDCNAMSLDLNR